MQQISGKLYLPKELTKIKNLTIYLSIEDISRQDVSSEIICKKVYNKVNPSLQNPLQFSMSVPKINENSHLIVKAHVDVDSDGEPSIGDYITTRMYSILTRGFSDKIDIYLEKIT